MLPAIKPVLQLTVIRLSKESTVALLHLFIGIKGFLGVILVELVGQEGESVEISVLLVVIFPRESRNVKLHIGGFQAMARIFSTFGHYTVSIRIASSSHSLTHSISPWSCFDARKRG